MDAWRVFGAGQRCGAWVGEVGEVGGWLTRHAGLCGPSFYRHANPGPFLQLVIQLPPLHSPYEPNATPGSIRGKSAASHVAGEACGGVPAGRAGGLK